MPIIQKPGKIGMFNNNPLVNNYEVVDHGCEKHELVVAHPTWVEITVWNGIPIEELHTWSGPCKIMQSVERVEREQ